MALATDILVVLLLILFAIRPKTRLLLGAAKMSVMMVPGALWLFIAGGVGLLAAWRLPHIPGQVVAALLISAIFAGIGLWIRRSRAKSLRHTLSAFLM
jgi:hypothetical protein